MTPDFFSATIFNLGINLIHALLALLVGVFGLRMIDRFLLKNLDIEEELKKGNIAVGIFAASLLFFIAAVLSFGLRG